MTLSRGRGLEGPALPSPIRSLWKPSPSSFSSFSQAPSLPLCLLGPFLVRTVAFTPPGWYSSSSEWGWECPSEPFYLLHVFEQGQGHLQGCPSSGLLLLIIPVTSCKG